MVGILRTVLAEHPAARAGSPGPCPEGAEDADGSRIPPGLPGREGIYYQGSWGSRFFSQGPIPQNHVNLPVSAFIRKRLFERLGKYEQEGIAGLQEVVKPSEGCIRYRILEISYKITTLLSENFHNIKGKCGLFHTKSKMVKSHRDCPGNHPCPGCAPLRLGRPQAGFIKLRFEH